MEERDILFRGVNKLIQLVRNSINIDHNLILLFNRSGYHFHDVNIIPINPWNSRLQGIEQEMLCISLKQIPNISWLIAINLYGVKRCV